MHARGRVAGVLERVGERLLHDPIGRQLDPDRQLAALPFQVQLDRQAGIRDASHERRQITEPRLWLQRVGGVAAKHSDETTHLGERAAPDVLDRFQHLTRRPVCLVDHAPLCPRLHDHHRDVVCDRVV